MQPFSKSKNKREEKMVMMVKHTFKKWQYVVWSVEISYRSRNFKCSSKTLIKAYPVYPNVNI